MAKQMKLAISLSFKAVKMSLTLLGCLQVLGFIGSKMIADYFGYELSTELSLGVVATLLGGGVAASLLLPEPSKTK